MSSPLDATWKELKLAAAAATAEADAEARAAGIAPAGLLKRLRLRFARRAAIMHKALRGPKRINEIRVRGIRLRAGKQRQPARRKLGA